MKQLTSRSCADDVQFSVDALRTMVELRVSAINGKQTAPLETTRGQSMCKRKNRWRRLELCLGVLAIFGPLITLGAADILYPGQYALTLMSLWNIPASAILWFGIRFRRLPPSHQRRHDNDKKQ